MAKKGTKAHATEYVEVIYGIHPPSQTVRSLYLQRDGKMMGENREGMPVTHFVAPGRRAENEAVIVFGLSDVFSVPIMLNDSEHTKLKLEELRAKARSESS